MSKKLSPSRRIVSIEFDGVEEVKCIMVGHDSHQYVTDDFIVTHNTHSQRQARIDRIGQKNAIDLIDLVADHQSEHDARDRLERKYGLKDLMASPLDGLDDEGYAGAILARRVEAEQAAQAEAGTGVPEVPEIGAEEKAA